MVLYIFYKSSRTVYNKATSLTFIFKFTIQSSTDPAIQNELLLFNNNRNTRSNICVFTINIHDLSKVATL
jgi:hypothetical protein